MLSRNLREAWPFIPSFAVMALLLCHTWCGPDIWYHLAWGRAILADHQTSPQLHHLFPQPLFSNNAWLFQVAAFTLFDLGGIPLVSAFFLLLWTLIALVWLRSSGCSRSPILGSALFLVFVVIAHWRFEARPEIGSYLILALLVWNLQCTDWEKPLRLRQWLTFFVLEAIWVNWHAYFVFGPLLGLALLISTVLESRSFGSFASKNAARLLATLTLATLVSAFGWKSWETTAHLSRLLSGLHFEIQEALPLYKFPVSAPIVIFFSLWVLVVGSACYSIIWRQRWFAGTVALGGAALAFFAIRNVPLFLLLSAPLINEVVNTLPPLNNKTVKRIYGSAFSLGCLGFSLAIANGDYHRYLGSGDTFGLSADWAAYPIGAVEYLESIGFSGKIFSHPSDGGYIEFHQPALSVVGDTYFSDADLTRTLLNAALTARGFYDLDAKIHFDAAVVFVESLDLTDALLRDVNWQLAYADSHRLVFQRIRSGDRRPLDANKIAFYHGEDLRRRPYTLPPVTWTVIAVKYNMPGVIEKILRDVRSAPYVPSGLVKFALKYALDGENRNLIPLALALKDRVFESEKDDLIQLKTLEAQARGFVGEQRTE